MAEQVPDMSIADAILTRRFELSGGGFVDVYVWKPYEGEGGNHFECHYKIVGLGKDRFCRGVGVDPIQALTLALQSVGVSLYHSDEYKNDQLTYLGDRDLDLPLIAGNKPGYAKFETAELLSSVGYPTVIKMPGDRFPHISYPGEALKRLVSRLARASSLIGARGAEAQDILTKTISGLIVQQKYYEAVCREIGYHPSYKISVEENNDAADNSDIAND